MALNDGDKAECKEIAREIIKEVIAEHIAACPHGQSYNMFKARFVGICMGVGVGSSGLAAIIMRVFGA